ncbi:MAG: DUF1189 domain-containing protein [Alkalibacterium sp.]|nr:DUF1189 domain-containing protein [Alkalibacterium sp.]
MKEYILIGFRYPQRLVRAKNMTRKQVFGYFALLTLILTFSMTSVLTNVMTNLRQDGSEIAETIPPFTIENNQLNVEENQESYVHQTNSFLLFFDPNGAIQTEEIDTNLERLNVPIGIGLMQDEFYLSVTGRTIPVSYDQLDGLNHETFIDLLSQIGRFSPLVLLLMFVVAYLASGLVLLYEWLIVALFANILVTLLRLRFPFKKNARMALVSLSIPTLILSLIEAFGFIVPFAFEFKLGFTIYFLFTSLRAVAPKKKKKDD